MCKKSKKMVGGVLLCIGFLIVAGAVGGIDGDTIDLLPGALQIMIGFILSGVGIEYGELFNPPVMDIENYLKENDCQVGLTTIYRHLEKMEKENI